MAPSATPSSPDVPSAPLHESDLHDESLPHALAHLDGDALDTASFGIVRLDDDGMVRFYNAFESDLSGVDPEDASGMSFFEELAPCTNTPAFAGRFFTSVEADEPMDQTFEYTFTYRVYPTVVTVRMCEGPEGQNWVLVLPSE